MPTEAPAALTKIARQGEPGAPFINTWLVLGTFDNDARNSGYNRDFIGESAVEPQQGATLAGQTWRYFDDRLFSRNYDDYQDLFSYYGVKRNGSNASSAAKVAYAHVYVWSPRAQHVQLRVGADTSFKAWLNGAPAAASTRSTPNQLVTETASAHLNVGRDYVASEVGLRSGWNRLLLKIANRAAGRFGFYARLTQGDGSAVTGLEYSCGGGQGKLAIATGAMPEAGTGALPTAWREWSYVEARPDIARLRELGKSASGPNGQKPPFIEGMGLGFTYNAGLGMQASPFRFTAQGGAAPYRWTKTKGTLPAGLRLEADGTLRGTPAARARLGESRFTVRVQDAKGASARQEYSLLVRERPNRWIETARLTALIHGPERMKPDDIPALARLMKRQGYGLGVPVAYNNGDFLFRWPSAFGKKRTETDVVAAFKSALEREGLQFGMYLGNLNVMGATEFSVNQQVLVLEEALRRYRPKALWFDWLGLDGTSLDSLYSAIRSIDPDVLLILNGAERMSNGDWDIICWEGFNAWGAAAWRTWPTAQFPWPKKNAPESWRLAVQPEWEMSGGTLSDWREMLRVQLSLIGEGFIADMDHSASIYAGQKGAFADYPLVKIHSQMADWANSGGAPPLYEAYTNVAPGPLPAASWGYNTINLARDAIYLLALKNPRGKSGLPANGALPVQLPAGARVKAITWMNGNAPLPFSQDTRTHALTINTRSVRPDEIATIIKIALRAPLTVSQAQAPALTAATIVSPARAVPEGNLASFKPAWLLRADGTRELGPSTTNYAIYGVDGDPGTTAQAGGEWAWSYKVDLQKRYTLRRIIVHFDVKVWATEFEILVSQDGAQWQSVAHSNAGKPGANAFAIEPAPARFVRVQALKPDAENQPGGQMGIAELQVFDK